LLHGISYLEHLELFLTLAVLFMAPS